MYGEELERIRKEQVVICFLTICLEELGENMAGFSQKSQYLCRVSNRAYF
jgi:hypothetical protein